MSPTRCSAKRVIKLKAKRELDLPEVNICSAHEVYLKPFGSIPKSHKPNGDSTF